MRTYTKEELIDSLQKIRNMGWIPSQRRGNAGGVGNTLEDLLEISENNLPIPNASEWELKAQRIGTNSLTTLFHLEPSPRAIKFVPRMLLPKYGWEHRLAGTRYPENEKSFRQTISGLGPSDRGFMVKVNWVEEKVVISFDSSLVSSRHSAWLDSVEARVGLGELDPQPFYGFNDLFHKAGTKLINTFYIQAETRIENGCELFRYSNIMILKDFKIEIMAEAIEEGNLFIDFDARTGHNHGTKFRVKQNALPLFYANVTVL